MKKCIKFFASAICIFVFFFIFSVQTTAQAVIPSGVVTTTMESEISNFLNSNSDFVKIDGIKNMEFQEGVPNKVQLFRRRILSNYVYKGRLFTANSKNLGDSFSLSSGTSSSTSKINGGFFDASIGASIEGDVNFYDYASIELKISEWDKKGGL